MQLEMGEGWKRVASALRVAGVIAGHIAVWAFNYYVVFADTAAPDKRVGQSIITTACALVIGALITAVGHWLYSGFKQEGGTKLRVIKGPQPTPTVGALSPTATTSKDGALSDPGP